MMRAWSESTIAVLMLAAVCGGCSSGPAYEISSLQYVRDEAKLERHKASAVGYWQQEYAVVRVQGKLLEPGWVFRDLKVTKKLSMSVRDEQFTIVPRFKKAKGAEPAEFTAHHTFGFDTFLLEFPPRIICADKELGGPDSNQPSKYRDDFP